MSEAKYKVGDRIAVTESGTRYFESTTAKPIIEIFAKMHGLKIPTMEDRGGIVTKVIKINEPPSSHVDAPFSYHTETCDTGTWESYLELVEGDE